MAASKQTTGLSETSWLYFWDQTFISPCIVLHEKGLPRLRLDEQKKASSMDFKYLQHTKNTIDLIEPHDCKTTKPSELADEFTKRPFLSVFCPERTFVAFHQFFCFFSFKKSYCRNKSNSIFVNRQAECSTCWSSRHSKSATRLMAADRATSHHGCNCGQKLRKK